MVPFYKHMCHFADMKSTKEKILENIHQVSGFSDTHVHTHTHAP